MCLKSKIKRGRKNKWRLVSHWKDAALTLTTGHCVYKTQFSGTCQLPVYWLIPSSRLPLDLLHIILKTLKIWCFHSHQLCINNSQSSCKQDVRMQLLTPSLLQTKSINQSIQLFQVVRRPSKSNPFWSRLSSAQDPKTTAVRPCWCAHQVRTPSASKPPRAWRTPSLNPLVFHFKILSSIIWSTFLPVSPTRRRSGYPSRTPVPRRRHSCSGAMRGALTSPAPGESDDLRGDRSPSSGCG